MSNSADSQFNEWLPHEKADVSGQQKRTIIDILKEFASLSFLLRTCGALMVVASMSAFLLQDWALGNDINRFYLLIGQTLLLSLGGFALSFLLKENKGARVFFSLGLISVAVYMTTLGALIFSTVQWSGDLISYPAHASWVAPSIAAISVPTAIAFAVMIPVVIFAYTVLARRHAKAFSLMYLFGNILLLLPIRESLMLGIVILSAAVIPLWYLQKRFSRDAGLHTFEGRFAILTLFVPIIVIVARNLWLYQFDLVLQMILAAVLFVTVRVFSQGLTSDSSVKYCLNWVSVGIAGFIAYPAAQLISDLSSLVLPASIYYSAAGFVFSTFVLDIAKRSEWNKQAFANISGLALIIAHIMQSLFVGGMTSAILTVFGGIFVLMIGKTYARKHLLVLGAVTILIGMAQQVYQAISLVDFSHWISLAVTGMLAIIIASLLERYGAVIKLKWNKWSNVS